jgi:hypothetical protein
MMTSRWVGALAAAALSICVAACDLIRAPEQAADATVGAETGVRTRPDTRVDDIAIGEPGAARRQWRAANQTARDVTGNLTASLPDGRAGQLVLAFATGVTLRLDTLGMRLGSDAVGAGGPTFAGLLNADPNVGVFVYKVANEKVDNIAPKGGLCGGAKTTYVAIAEFIGPDGDWVFRGVSFKGAAAPDPAGADPQLCNAFAYTLD